MRDGVALVRLCDSPDGIGEIDEYYACVSKGQTWGRFNSFGAASAAMGLHECQKRETAREAVVQ